MLLINVNPVYKSSRDPMASCNRFICIWWRLSSLIPPLHMPWRECEEHRYLFRCVLPVSAAAERRCETVNINTDQGVADENHYCYYSQRYTRLCHPKKKNNKKMKRFEPGLVWCLCSRERSLTGGHPPQAACHGTDVTGSPLVDRAATPRRS